MTLTRRALDKIAICSSRLSANNYISVAKKDFKTLDVQPQDEVRVFLIRSDLNRELKPNDRASYKTTLTKSSQVYCPKDVRDQLELETGDLVKYIIIPGNEFPGLSDGPIRDKFRQLFTSTSVEDDQRDPERERPNATQGSATFSNKMQVTGQVTVPSDIMEALGLIEGDTTSFMIKNPNNGETLQVSKQIGTGKRITIVKDEREDLGLTKGDEPQILALAKQDV